MELIRWQITISNIRTSKINNKNRKEELPGLSLHLFEETLSTKINLQYLDRACRVIFQCKILISYQICQSLDRKEMLIRYRMLLISRSRAIKVGKINRKVRNLIQKLKVTLIRSILAKIGCLDQYLLLYKDRTKHQVLINQGSL